MRLYIALLSGGCTSTLAPRAKEPIPQGEAFGEVDVRLRAPNSGDGPSGLESRNNRWHVEGWSIETMDGM